MLVPNIQLSLRGSELALTPATTGQFIDGVWTGPITIHESGGNVTLIATDTNDITGTSNLFTVESMPLISVSGPIEVSENSGTVTGSASIPFALSYDLDVLLESSLINELVVPESIIIPAGETSVDFTITVIDDTDLDLDKNVTLNAYATLFESISTVVTVLDNETAQLFVTLPPSAFESYGLMPGQGQVTVSRASSVDVIVELQSDDITELQLPETVMISAGQTIASFDLLTIDDTLIDGTQSVIVTAHVNRWTDGHDSIDIHDNEHLDLMMYVPEDAWEGDGLLDNTGNIAISGVLDYDLVINLYSDDTSEVTVESSVIIRAGNTGVPFDLSIVDDSEYDGTQSVPIRASAQGFNNTSLTMNIHDDDIHAFEFVMEGMTSVTASVPFAVTITALDINSQPVLVYDKTVQLSGYGDHGPVEVEPIGTGPFNNGIWSGTLAVHNIDSNITITVDDGIGQTGVSPTFDSLVGPLAGFDMLGLDDTVYVNWPTEVTISARDANGYLVDSFNDVCNLAGYNASGQNVQISPVTTGHFTNGEWTGWITLLSENLQMYLTASHVGGVSTDSNTFDAVLLPPPAYIELACESDTGISDHDAITQLNNSDPEHPLQFIAHDTIAGTTVAVYADGVEIGRADAGSSITVVTTDGITILNDGEHTITAQTIGPYGLVSAMSPSVLLTVDTTAPGLIAVNPLLTTDSTPLLNGTIDDPEADIQLLLAGQVFSADNLGNGNWMLQDNTISPPLNDGLYDVQVTATDMAGNVAFDSTVDELNIVTLPPPCPMNVSATGHDGHVDLSWSMLTHQPVLYYIVYRSTTPDSGYRSVAVAFDAMHIRDCQVINDTTYYYMIKAVNTLGMISDYSDCVEVTPQIPGPDVLIPVSDQAAVIDGMDTDGEWTDAPAHQLTHINHGTLTDNLDLSGAWKAMWDSEYLYYLVEVTDDLLIQDSPAYQSPDDGWWNDDCVEIFIDADNSKSSQYDQINDYQFGFRWNDATVQTGQNSLGSTEGILYEMNGTDKGYRLEAAIPWSTLGVSPVDGMRIGMDVHIGDDDDGGTRDSKRSWFEMTDHAWINPSLLATAGLTDSSSIHAWSGHDVGDVVAYGSYTEDAGVFTVLGDGSDIWEQEDRFYYVNQTYLGDCEIIARVDSQQNTNEWAKAGVMIRESLDEDSKHAFLALTPTNGMAFQRRLETGADTLHNGSSGEVPGWIKMIRHGDTITAYSSSDGVIWSETDCVTIAMPASVNIGLAVTSHSEGVLCEVQFSNVVVTPIQACNEAMIDDADPSMNYQGTWNERLSLGGRLNNSTHETEQAGASMEMTFTGNIVELIGEKQPWGGDADVYIDGIYFQTVNFLHGTPDQYQQSIFRLTGLNQGQHTLRIECNGNGWIYVDAVQVNAADAWVGESLPIELPVVEQTAPSSDSILEAPEADSGSQSDDHDAAAESDTSDIIRNIRLNHARQKLTSMNWPLTRYAFGKTLSRLFGNMQQMDSSTNHFDDIDTNPLSPDIFDMMTGR